MYSWIRLTWTSKIESGSTASPVADRSQSANRPLATRFAARNFRRNAGSSASGTTSWSRARSVTQPSPTASVNRDERPGLARSSQRRGVTPFVLLLNRAGNSPARSLSTVSRSSREWSAATPLVLCDPTTARCAIRTFFSGPSSIRLTRETRPSSPGDSRGPRRGTGG